MNSRLLNAETNSHSKHMMICFDKGPGNISLLPLPENYSFSPTRLPCPMSLSSTCMCRHLVTRNMTGTQRYPLQHTRHPHLGPCMHAGGHCAYRLTRLTRALGRFPFAISRDARRTMGKQPIRQPRRNLRVQVVHADRHPAHGLN